MIEGKPIVITYRPGQKYVLLALVLAAVAALLVVGKLWGTVLSNQQLAEMLRLEEKTVELQAQLDDKSAELSRVALSAEVDMAALEKSRQEMIGLQQQIYQRDEELELYRELLQDNNQPNGLSVSDLNLSVLEDGRIRYRWVARQKTAKMKTLSVYADMWVIGRQGEEEVTLSLADIDDEVKRLPLKREFKYFSIIQGILKLPEDFEPEKVRVALRYTWMDKFQSDQKFDWKIEE
ncbi:MAG: hypothetical protein P8N12_08840 [Porticoccaceae bacterium]|nr:hypothetical protein [Porticoccaceae bacterium]